MRPALRGAAGVAVGGGALLAYLWLVGAGDVLDRLGRVSAGVLCLALALVVAEGLADGIGVWASVRPLGDGLTPARSVLFALAGDFFDTVSPAGAASSEPIMARFFAVETGTDYSEALGVRSVAKYVKAGTQLLVSGLLAVAVLSGRPAGDIAPILGGALLVLAAAGAAAVAFRDPLSRAVVAAATPIVARLSALYREEPHDRETVAAAVAGFRRRAGQFRDRPALSGLIALGGLLEQLLIAAALWTVLSAAGPQASFLAIVVVVPLPQAATVVPIPASLGSYDLLLTGALVAATGATVVAATTAALVVRTLTIGFAVAVGGLSVAFLRGWTPRDSQ